VSQGPEPGKSRKPLPHRNRAADFAITPLPGRSRWRDSAADAGGSELPRAPGPALPEMSHFDMEF
jgi:hypothetical protein